MMNSSWKKIIFLSIVFLWHVSCGVETQKKASEDKTSPSQSSGSTQDNSLKTSISGDVSFIFNLFSFPNAYANDLSGCTQVCGENEENCVLVKKKMWGSFQKICEAPLNLVCDEIEPTLCQGYFNIDINQNFIKVGDEFQLIYNGPKVGFRTRQVIIDQDGVFPISSMDPIQTLETLISLNPEINPDTIDLNDINLAKEVLKTRQNKFITKDYSEDDLRNPVTDEEKAIRLFAPPGENKLLYRYRLSDLDNPSQTSTAPFSSSISFKSILMVLEPKTGTASSVLSSSNFNAQIKEFKSQDQLTTLGWEILLESIHPKDFELLVQNEKNFTSSDQKPQVLAINLKNPITVSQFLAGADVVDFMLYEEHLKKVSLDNFIDLINQISPLSSTSSLRLSEFHRQREMGPPAECDGPNPPNLPQCPSTAVEQGPKIDCKKFVVLGDCTGCGDLVSRTRTIQTIDASNGGKPCSEIPDPPSTPTNQGCPAKPCPENCTFETTLWEPELPTCPQCGNSFVVTQYNKIKTPARFGGSCALPPTRQQTIICSLGACTQTIGPNYTNLPCYERSSGLWSLRKILSSCTQGNASNAVRCPAVGSIMELPCPADLVPVTSWVYDSNLCVETRQCKSGFDCSGILLKRSAPCPAQWVEGAFEDVGQCNFARCEKMQIRYKRCMNGTNLSTECSGYSGQSVVEITRRLQPCGKCIDVNVFLIANGAGSFPNNLSTLMPNQSLLRTRLDQTFDMYNKFRKETHASSANQMPGFKINKIYEAFFSTNLDNQSADNLLNILYNNSTPLNYREYSSGHTATAATPGDKLNLLKDKLNIFIKGNNVSASGTQGLAFIFQNPSMTTNQKIGMLIMPDIYKGRYLWPLEHEFGHLLGLRHTVDFDAFQNQVDGPPTYSGRNCSGITTHKKFEYYAIGRTNEDCSLKNNMMSYRALSDFTFPDGCPNLPDYKVSHLWDNSNWSTAQKNILHCWLNEALGSLGN